MVPPMLIAIGVQVDPFQMAPLTCRSSCLPVGFD